MPSIYSNFIQGLTQFLNTKITGITDIGDTDIVSVSSTCLSEVRYNLLTRTLEVTFEKSGASYAYYNVPESVYEDLVNAKSVGQEYVFGVRNTIWGMNYARTG